MDFNLSKEQEKFFKETVLFAKKNLNDSENLEAFSYDMWKKVAEFGIFGLNVEQEYDGLEESYLTAALVIEALGYACENNGFVFAVNNHIWVGLNLIQQYGTKELKDKYLKKMVHGELIGAIAITEPDSGSDALSGKTIAEECQNDYQISGSKIFISNGSIADVFIVFAKLNDKMTAFVVEKNMEGIEVSKDIEKMGLGGCPMNEISFNHCMVPKMNVLGRIGAGENILNAALEWERCYEFACHIGAMQRILETCLKYVSERKQFGKTLSNYQAITHKIADMKTKIELGRIMLYKIAWMKDQKKSAYLEASIFKLFVSEAYIQTCKDAMQIFGAYGYVKEYNIEREMRDALACSIYSGTSEIQRNTIFSMATLDLL